VRKKREEERGTTDGEAQFIIHLLELLDTRDWVQGLDKVWEGEYNDVIPALKELPIKFQKKVAFEKCSVWMASPAGV
jgi:hypothetical protein